MLLTTYAQTLSVTLAFSFQRMDKKDMIYKIKYKITVKYDGNSLVWLKRHSYSKLLYFVLTIV